MITSPVSNPQMPGPGAKIGPQYQVVRRLGSGTMGEVFLARDVELDRFVAIKVLHSDMSPPLETDARFRREARLLSRLNHPHVVVIHAFGSAPAGLHYIVMEYIEGETLEARLQQCEQLGPDVFCHVFGQICSAVAEAHRHGIVHRDLKPANVLLRSLSHDPNYVKVVDLGVAKVFGHDTEERDAGVRLTTDGNMIGTPLYMSPEQADAQAVDGRSDIYALGVMACEMLTGKLPHEASTLRQLLLALLSNAPMLPSRLRPDLGFKPGNGVDAVLARALEKAPERRYETVDEFAQELLREVRRWARLGDRGSSPILPSYGYERPGVPLREDLRLPATIRSEESPGSQGAAEHRIRSATVLHLDIQADPYTDEVEVEEYADCIALVGSKIHQAVTAQRGIVLDPLTDRQLAIFYPDVGSNDVERAIDAALAVRSALVAFATDPTVPPSFRLAFRVGVGAGRIVHVASSGQTPIVIGAPLFEARRLAQSAATAEVRISRSASRRVRGLYECSAQVTSEADAAGAIVHGKKLTTHIRPNEIYGVRIDLVGRDAELEALRAAMRDVKQSRTPRAVFLTGPAGVGKSRIIAELVKELDEQTDSQFYELGRCTPGWQGLPYEPVIQAIRWRARIQQDDLIDQARLKLEHYFRRFLAADPTRLDEGDRQLIHQIEALLGIDDGAEEIDTTAQESVRGDGPRRKVLFDAVTTVYRRLASRFPLVFVIEDAEWATTPTTSLLDHMLAHLGNVPVLFLISARAEGENEPYLTFLRNPSSATRIPITALEPAPAEALTRHMLRELVEVPSWLVRGITALAGGVPLIIEETIHDLIDERLIDVSAARWRVSAGAGTAMPLPGTVEQLLVGRLERLSPNLRAILQTAAVTGRRFWPAMLDELTEGGCASEDLEELTRRGFFVARGELLIHGEPDYAFSQLAVQEAVYRSVPRPRRRQLHKAVALWIERRIRGSRVRHDDALGHHFLEAGEPLRALPYMRSAADRAMRTHALREAIAHLESCREILTHATPSDMPDADRRRMLAEVLADLVHQLVLVGDLERAAALGDDALGPVGVGSSAATSVQAARVAIWRGWALEHLGRYADARSSFVSARDFLGGEGDVLLLMALTGEAGATDKLGDPDACARTLRGALERFSALRSPDPAVERALSAAYRVLANAEMGLGSYDAALATFDRAYDLALSANAPVDAVDALNSRGALHYFRGQTLADRGVDDEAKRELDRAESTWQLALAQADQWDLLQHRSIILSNLGELEWLRGDAARAIVTLEKAEALHMYLRSDQGLADTYRLFGECHLAIGSLARAEEYAARGLAIAERLDSPYRLGPIHRTMARVGHALSSASPDDAAARTRVKEHLGVSLRAFEKAGMVREVERTLTLARELGFDETALHH